LRKLRNKRFSLLMALVFAFTMVFPWGVAFAAEDNVSISGSYNYVKADDNKEAGTIRVKEDGMEEGTQNIVIQLSLPEGVEFSDYSEAKEQYDSWITYTSTADAIYVDGAGSSYFEFRLNGIDDVTSGAELAKFDFSVDGVSLLDINDDFTGNLDVAVDVIGMAIVDGKESILWTDNDDVTIAKVSSGDVDVVVGDTKKVSVGGDKEVADITLEESMAGSFEKGEIITLEIETDGVEFSSVTPDPTRLGVKYDETVTSLDEESVDLGRDTNNDDEYVFYRIQITDPSQSLPGKLKFDAIKLDIAPDVSGDIEISVTSDGDADIDETVTVATIGDVTAEVIDIEDNDGTVYAGQKKELDVEFKLATTDGSDFKDNAGDIITFELNMGEFDGTPKVDDSSTGVKLYSDEESFYYTVQDNDGDEIKISGITVVLDNDVEPGDITLTIGGDFGDLGEVTIAQAAKPYTVTAEKPSILAEALGQEAGDLIITETNDGAFKTSEYIYVELPSGIELTAKPKIEITEGSADAKIADYDDDFFVIEITEESSSKPSVIRVYNIKYDTGKLALTGDVELELKGDVDANGATNGWDFDDDSVMTTVVNATVVDENAVTASYKLGDEGVAIQNGRTLVQVNTLCDTLGLQKSWDPATKTAYFFKNGTVVAFPIGTNQLVINGNNIPVDQGGVIINGATYATLRGIQAAFGGDLQWDDTTKTATFNF